MVKLRLVQLKILHRIYYTRVTLHKIGKADSTLCLRRCGAVGTFYHILWECPIILTYWETIMRIITQFNGVTVQPEPKRCLLNLWEPTDLNHAAHYWVMLGMMFAK